MSIPGWPGAPYETAPPPRGNRGLRTVLIVAGVVLAVCCAGGIVGGVFLFRGAAKGIGPARDAADRFVTDLQDGDTTGAYDLLCARTRSAFTPDVFARGVGSQPKIVSHAFGGINLNSGRRGTTATVTMKLTTSSGFVDQHAFPLVEEDGAWKVCGSPY
jgi:hypothetical protein